MGKKEQLRMGNTWQVQDAETRFSEMLDTVIREGPQIVARQGVEAAAVIPIDHWRRFEHAVKPTLKDLLLAPGPRDESLTAPRRESRRRELPLFD